MEMKPLNDMTGEELLSVFEKLCSEGLGDIIGDSSRRAVLRAELLRRLSLAESASGAVQAEREACAKIADKIAQTVNDPAWIAKRSAGEEGRSVEAGVYSRPECPFNYCDQKVPFASCRERCRHISTEAQAGESEVGEPLASSLKMKGENMSAMTPVSPNDPLMIAWEEYKATEEFANSLRWAMASEYSPDRPIPEDQRVSNAEGSLWSAFMCGFRAPQRPIGEPLASPQAIISESVQQPLEFAWSYAVDHALDISYRPENFNGLRIDEVIAAIAEAYTAPLRQQLQAAQTSQARLSDGLLAQKARAEKAERDIEHVAEERDKWHDLIGDLALVAGCTEEWSNLHAHGECIKEELAALKASDGWVKRAERMPEIDKPVIVWRFGFSGNERTEFGVVAMLTVDEDEDTYWEDWAGNDMNRDCVTHWRPLPAPPEGQKGGSK